MQHPFSPAALQRLMLVLLAAAGLLTTACKKDYVKVDDNNITNAQRQESGLYYVPFKTDTARTAVKAVPGQIVSVLYAGMLMNGTVFDASSLHGNVPISFELGRGRVIKGWDEGIALMHKGDQGELLIPSALAYGEAGASPSIPSNAVLRFKVELVDVK
jgi:FKBP-type peptidyl-prolyl cis-trans isomerase